MLCGINRNPAQFRQGRGAAMGKGQLGLCHARTIHQNG